MLSPKMRRVTRLTVVLVLVLSLGLHWALLQTVAWTGMIVSYSLEGSFSAALTKTFDGKHPCCLCKAIAASKKSEKKSEAVPLVLKLEFLPVAKRIILVAPKVFKSFPVEQLSADSFFPKPPLPPPRISSVAV